MDGMPFPQPRRPAGTPTGGRFAPAARPEPAATLNSTPGPVTFPAALGDVNVFVYSEVATRKVGWGIGPEVYGDHFEQAELSELLDDVADEYGAASDSYDRDDWAADEFDRRYALDKDDGVPMGSRGRW